MRTGSSRTLLQAVRADPHHASELVLLRVLAQLAPNVIALPKAGVPVEQATKRLIRRATSLARRDGAITGSSFYVGMPSAMAMIYCHRLLLVLRIAALYGREPADAARAAEMLVFQGRYADMETAAAALRRAGTAAASPDHHGFSIRTTVVQTVRQVPQMVGMRVQKVRRGRPWGVVISTATLASYLVPFVGVPAWAASNGRTTRQLGRAAVAYYAAHPEPPTPDPVVLPTRPGPRARILLTCAVIAAGVILGVAAAMIPLGTTHLEVPRWVVIVLMELFLAVTFSRLLWITREPSTTTPA